MSGSAGSKIAEPNDPGYRKGCQHPGRYDSSRQGSEYGCQLFASSFWFMQAKYGMSVPKHRMKYAEDGMAVPEGEDPPVADFPSTLHPMLT